MPDISMCHGMKHGTEGDIVPEICSLRESCWRHLAPPTPHWQYYFLPPVLGEQCEFYWPMKTEKEVK